jgi:WD repeat-containing protein 48
MCEPRIDQNADATLTFFCQSTAELNGEQTNSHCATVQSVAVDDDYVFTASRDATIRQWRRSSPHTHVRVFEEHDSWVNDVAVLNGGAMLASASSDTTVKLWNVSGGRSLHTLHSHRDYVQALAYARTANVLFSASLDTYLLAWNIAAVSKRDVDDTTPVLPIAALNGARTTSSLYHVACTPDATRVVSGSSDAVVRVWDPISETGASSVLIGHTDMIR